MPATLVKPVLFDRAYIAQTGIIPEGKQFLQETMPLKIVDTKKFFTESVTGVKTPVMRLTGVFQRADEKNANGRVYPLEILKTAVENLQSSLKSRSILGEFDHPADAKIHMDRLSHLITKCWMEGKTVMGEIEVFNDPRMPMGAQLACLVDRNVQIGISSRGVGDMEIVMREGEDAYEVQEGFSFVTWDVVAEPSVKGAHLHLAESLTRKPDFKAIRQARESMVVAELRKFLRA